MAQIFTKTTDNDGDIPCMVLDSAERFVIPFPDHPAFNNWNYIAVFLTLGLTNDQEVDGGVGDDGPYGDKEYSLDTQNGVYLRNSPLFGFLNKPNEFPGENGCDYIGIRHNFTEERYAKLYIRDHYYCNFFRYSDRGEIGTINGDGSFTDHQRFDNFYTSNGENISNRSSYFCYQALFTLRIKNKGQPNQSMDFFGGNGHNSTTSNIQNAKNKIYAGGYRDSHGASDIPYPPSKNLPNAFILYLPFEVYRFKIFNFGVKRIA